MILRHRRRNTCPFRDDTRGHIQKMRKQRHIMSGQFALVLPELRDLLIPQVQEPRHIRAAGTNPEKLVIEPRLIKKKSHRSTFQSSFMKRQPTQLAVAMIPFLQLHAKGLVKTSSRPPTHLFMVTIEAEQNGGLAEA
jgi:hypothetical protein